MTIRLICPSCQSNVLAPEKAAGRLASCPKCQAKVKVPATTAPESNGCDANRQTLGTVQGSSEASNGNWLRHNSWKLTTVAGGMVAGIAVTVVFFSLRSQGSSSSSSSARIAVASSSRQNERVESSPSDSPASSPSISVASSSRAPAASSSIASVASSSSIPVASSSGIPLASSSSIPVASSSKPKDGPRFSYVDAIRPDELNPPRSISFLTTLDEFRKAYPNADLKAGGTDLKLNLVEYATEPKVANELKVTFFDGRLYELKILYSGKKLNDTLSYNVPAKLLQTYGDAKLTLDNITNVEQYDWQANDLTITLYWHRRTKPREISDEYILVDVKDNEIGEKIRMAKERLDNKGSEK